MKRHEQPDLFRDPPDRVLPDEDGVVVRETRCRTLLNRWEDRRYSFNCYTGCAHACGYCYARFMERFHPHDEPWGRFVDVKVNAHEALSRQVRRLAPGPVFACSACDGWQGVEQRYRLTRECCRLLLQAGFRLDIFTKSELVLRDLDVFQGRDMSLGVTITTPDEEQARVWEPRAAAVSARWRILKEAKKAGLRTVVMFGPLLPALSDTEEALSELFAMAAEAGADRICTDALNARPRVWPSVQAILHRHWPGLREHYRRLMFEADARSRHEAGLEKRIREAASKAGVADRLA